MASCVRNVLTILQGGHIERCWKKVSIFTGSRKPSKTE